MIIIGGLHILLKSFQESREAVISCLHTYGPNPSFKYPEQEDIFLARFSDIVVKVDLTTTNGRVPPPKRHRSNSK